MLLLHCQPIVYSFKNTMRLLPSTFILFLFFFLIRLIFLHSSKAQTDPTKIQFREKEKEALLDFMLSFEADSREILYSQTIHYGDDLCEWAVVGCDDSGHVAGLFFPFGLSRLTSYQLRPSLLELHHLTILDLSYNVFPMRIPNFIGSLSNLTYLDLSESGFYGEIPPHLGNLSNLEVLRLGPSNHLWANTLRWLSPLSSLSTLHLSDVNVSNAVDLASTLKMLPNLSEFICIQCSLPSVPLSSISYVNSTSLQTLDLSNTSVSPSTFSSLINGSNNLQYVALDYMQLEPYTLHGVLEVLTSGARNSIEELSLAGNNLNKLPFEGVMFPSLVSLDVSFNLLTDLSSQDRAALSSLTSLNVSSNRIKSSFSRIIQYLPTNLTNLDMSSNFIYGVITDAHLFKFSHLSSLILSDNSRLIFNFSKNWEPPFQLHTLYLRSCMVGPTFPDWILTQKMLENLDISNSMISGAIPDAFWNISSTIVYLNVSHNKITCKIPDLLLSSNEYPEMYLNSNAFYGPIPLFLFTSQTLDLSDNRFSTFSPFHHSILSYSPFEINLSSNRLSGSLLNWLFQFEDMVELNLENNMLSGTLPREIGSLWRLSVLHLGNNNFSGQLPSSLKNCTQLNILELGSNNFSGSVPSWIGESMPHLVVLTMRSNNFAGELPSTLCHLQSLQILDISQNRISGYIPKCICNFTTMSTNKSFRLADVTDIYNFDYSYENGYLTFLDYASIAWKGVMTDIYSRSLEQRNVINLSGNMLRGEIPIEVTALKDLRSLDLSRNGLNGSIPDEIGQMKLLELHNLSSNRLSGEIPKSLADLTFMGTLDLSNNNLFGRIPSSTQLQGFDASSYAGNPELCGEPVSANCPGDEDGHTTQPLYENKKDDQFDVQAFLAALGMGFAFGFLGVIGMLHYNRQFRLAFFHSVHNIVEMIIVTTTIYYSRIKRSLSMRKKNGVAVSEG